MKKTTLIKTMLLLCALVVGSGSVWATDVTVASGTFAKKTVTTGWTSTGTGTGTTGCIIVGKGESITSPSLNLSSYSKVTINISARRYGSLSGSKATIDASISGSSMGTVDATSTSVTALSAIEFTPTESMTAVSVVFTCTNATSAGSSHGAGIGSITIIGTPKNSGGDSSPNITLGTYSINPTSAEGDGTITVTYNNIASVDAEVKFYESDGTTPATYTWLDADINGDNNVYYTYDANAGASRTAYLKVHEKNSNVYSGLVTISQAAITVTPPAFSLEGGSYLAGSTFTITSAGNTIYYTTDGSTPNASSTEYTGPVAILAGKKTYKAIAIDANDISSTVVTRTITGITPVALPFGWDKGTTKATINSTTGVSQTGLDSDYSDADYKLKFNSDDDNIIIYTDEKPIKISIGVKMLGGGNTSKFSIQESTNGAEFTEVEQLTISGSQNDVVNLETTKSFAATTRVIKLNFIKGSNVGVGPVSITAATETIALNADCTDGEKIYGTYSSSNAFRVPAGLTVSAVGIDNEGKLEVIDYATGDVVKANTGVMVSAATAGDKTITLSAETGTEKAGNLLKPSGDAGISDANMTVADTKFYRLTMHNGTTIGFWWGAADGAAFDLAANKAYLAIPNASLSREGLWFGEESVTAIEAVKAQNVVKGEYFNLAGQRVAQPTKGLYIVNGRKAIVK